MCKKRAYDKARYESNAETVRARVREYQLANAETVRARQVAWVSANIEHCRATRRARYAGAPEAHLSRGRAWKERNAARRRMHLKKHRDTHKVVVRARTKLWAQRHPEKIATYAAARRAVQMGAEGQHTEEDRRRLREGGRCHECGAAGELHIDHCIPLQMPGNAVCFDWAWNLQLLCPSCNSTKSNRYITCWRPWPGGIG